MEDTQVIEEEEDEEFKHIGSNDTPTSSAQPTRPETLKFNKDTQQVKFTTVNFLHF